MTRPDITKIKTGDELKQWYWLKQELVDFFKLCQLRYTGVKLDIIERIASALDYAINNLVEHSKKVKPTSKFIWSKAELNLETIITDSYTSGLNSRKFFKQYCGDKFNFSIPIMAFLKNNCGKTL
jgi:hypothetical protein